MLRNTTTDPERPADEAGRAQDVQDITTNPRAIASAGSLKTLELGNDPQLAQTKTLDENSKGNEVHLSSLPSPPLSSYSILYTETRHMDGLFGGLVLRDTGLSTGPNVSRFFELDSGEGLQGEAQEVVEKALRHLNNPLAKAQLLSKANRLALSCGKISIKWQRSDTTHYMQLSGFWVDHRGKYFVTAKHFVDPMFKSHAFNGLDQKMRAFRDEGDSYVGSKLTEDGDTSSTIPVKLKSWEETSDTAIFEPIHDDAVVHHYASLEDIGYFTPGQKQQVFTTGYCAKDLQVSLQYLLEATSTFGVGGDKIKYVYDKLLQDPHGLVSRFHFLKEYYTEQLGTYTFNGEDRDKAHYLRGNTIEFSHIFIPDRRAVATGRIGMWDTRDKPPQPSDNTYSFSQLTDISLYPGLSGAPVIGFVGECCQILAKVYGGRANALLNDVMAFKEGYRAKIEELIGG